jgi:dihydrofolate reductase
MGRSLTSIVAVSKNGVIGSGNAMPWRIKSDVEFFKRTTTNNVVVMGRRTFDSIGKCLPKRYNVIVTHHSLVLTSEPKTCTVAGSISEALFRSSKAPNVYKEAYVIGGGMMYKQFAPFVDKYLITLVDTDVDGDTFFDLSILDSDDWKAEEVTRVMADGDRDQFSFKILQLISRNPKAVAQRRDACRDTFFVSRKRSPKGNSEPETEEAATQHHFFI